MRCYSPPPPSQQALGQIFNDDLDGFPFISDICFKRKFFRVPLVITTFVLFLTNKIKRKIIIKPDKKGVFISDEYKEPSTYIETQIFLQGKNVVFTHADKTGGG
jgi:hypothetical protein